MKKAQEAFSHYIRNQGLKLTRQRQAILDSIFDASGHFTAEELYDRMKTREIYAGKATIYRTLELLAKGGFLEAHDFGTGTAHYEKILGRAHHDHMVCLQCGKVIEFQCEEIEDLQDAQAKKHHFTILAHSHKIFGHCEACAKKASRLRISG